MDPCMEALAVVVSARRTSAAGSSPTSAPPATSARSSFEAPVDKITEESLIPFSRSSLPTQNSLMGSFWDPSPANNTAPPFSHTLSRMLSGGVGGVSSFGGSLFPNTTSAASGRRSLERSHSSGDKAFARSYSSGDNAFPGRRSSAGDGAFGRGSSSEDSRCPPFPLEEVSEGGAVVATPNSLSAMRLVGAARRQRPTAQSEYGRIFDMDDF